MNEKGPLVMFICKHKKVAGWIVNNGSQAIVQTQVLVLHLLQHHW